MDQGKNNKVFSSPLSSEDRSGVSMLLWPFSTFLFYCWERLFSYGSLKLARKKALLLLKRIYKERK